MKTTRMRWIICFVLIPFVAGCVPPSPTRTSSTTVAAYSPIGEPHGSPPSDLEWEVASLDSLPDLDDAASSPPTSQAQPLAAEPPAAAVPEMVAIDLQLPAPVFRGTPVPANEPFVEPPRGGPRPPFLAPDGTVNLAANRPVTSSDLSPQRGELDLIVDGDKEATDYGCLVLHPGTQWVQIDLGTTATVYAVGIWHNHAEGRVYRDVIVQVSDDQDFFSSETLFNNDYDNTSGMGIGTDLGYVETSEGKLIDGRGVLGRYVRLSSRGNHLDSNNHYTEVEVYGTR